MADAALGTGVAAAQLSVAEPKLNQSAAANGIVLMDGVGWGDLQIWGSYTGYFDSDVVELSVDSNRITWAEVQLHPDPGASITDHEWITGKDCLNVFWKSARLEGKAASLTIHAVSVLAGAEDQILKEVVTENNDGNHTICFDTEVQDGGQIVADVTATYVNGITGPASRSKGIMVDASPPELLNQEIFIREGTDCSGSPSDEGEVLPFVAALTLAEPHSKMAKVESRVDGGAWSGTLYTSIAGAEPGQYGYEFRPSVAGWTSVTQYELRFTNGAGLETILGVEELPLRDSYGDCPGDVVVEPGSGGSGGCTTGGSGNLDFLLISAMIWFIRRRQVGFMTFRS
jgi:hypothetical protein